MQLSIIIVSYNTKPLTLKCLQSIFIRSLSATHCPLEVILIDNASRDGTVLAVRAEYPQVRIITNSANIGFAKANNQGVREAHGKYVWLLNSDTEMKENTISDLLGLCEEDSAAIATCRLLNPDGTIQPQGGFLPNLINLPLWMLNLDNLPAIRNLLKPYQLRYPSFFLKDRRLGWASGTALLVKKSVYEELHGLDEKIFMYAEDLDFCFRAQKIGYRVRYFQEPLVIHRGQGSSSSAEAILGEYRGLLYYYRKHKPAWQLPILKFWLKAGALLRSAVFGMIGSYEKQKIYTRAFSLVR
jgi:hypothetical protein